MCVAFSERAVEYVICFHCELFAYGRILIAFKVHCPYAKTHENKRTIFEIDIFFGEEDVINYRYITSLFHI